MDCGGKRSATPLFEPEGSSFKLVVSSCVRKRRRKMELKEGPGRFATSFALPAQSIMLPQHPSWPSDVVGDV